MQYKKFMLIFQKEFDKYVELKNVIEEKRNFLIDNDLKSLAYILESENQLIKEIENLENKRNEFLRENNSQEVLSFQDVLSYASEIEKNNMRQLRKNFLEILKEITNLNKSNKQIIEQALQVNKISLQALHSTLEQSGVYNKPGNKKKNSQHIIDRKV
ncbi:MAG: flagellar protein FlgN [bacterium]